MGNVSNANKQKIISILPFSVVSLPVTYLGVPLLTSRLSAKDYKVLTDIIMKRIKSWLTSSLSYAGRLLLVKTTLFSMQVYSSLFILPAAVSKECKKILMRFLWSGLEQPFKSSKVVWAKVCLLVQEGGLGIKRINEWNKAGQSFWILSLRCSPSWTWRKILGLKELMMKLVSYRVGEGGKISLWKDPWLNHKPLISVYGHIILYNAGILENATLNVVIREGQWDWPRYTPELQEVSNGCSTIPIRPICSDGIFWIKSGNEFCISAALEATRTSNPISSWAKSVWFSKNIPRQSFCVWLNFKLAHKTRDRLLKYSIVHTSTCLLGCGEEESTAHLFFYACGYTKAI
ncbi:LOW QUALITY PROTEIN: zf-RVT domain-containing protein, partial [Cephalotus follicularis]